MTTGSGISKHNKTKNFNYGKCCINPCQDLLEPRYMWTLDTQYMVLYRWSIVTTSQSSLVNDIKPQRLRVKNSPFGVIWSRWWGHTAIQFAIYGSLQVAISGQSEPTLYPAQLSKREAFIDDNENVRIN